jgi:hypothetical protein
LAAQEDGGEGSATEQVVHGVDVLLDAFLAFGEGAF